MGRLLTKALWLCKEIRKQHMDGAYYIINFVMSSLLGGGGLGVRRGVGGGKGVGVGGGELGGGGAVGWGDGGGRGGGGGGGVCS